MKTIEPKLEDDQIIPMVEDVFNRWIIGGIEAVSKSSGISLSFVLIACAIDYLAGFWKGGVTNKEDYIAFLDAYPVFSSKYSSKDIYRSLRCGLVHNFTIHNGAYALTSGDSNNHLKKAKTNHIILNFEEFYDDFKELKESLFKEVKTDENMRKRFIDRFRSIGFLVHTKIPV